MSAMLIKTRQTKDKVKSRLDRSETSPLIQYVSESDSNPCLNAIGVVANPETSPIITEQTIPKNSLLRRSERFEGKATFDYRESSSRGRWQEQ